MTTKLNYLSDEKSMLDKNNDLLKELGDDIILDGFYPNYTQQKVKILFIGREALSVKGSYIETLYEAYKDNDIGSKSLDAHQFHRIMFYLAYAINNELPEWDNIPYASKIADTFAEENGLSFAFINLSKLSNDSEDWHKDEKLIKSYIERVKESGKNYFLEQIKILNPDMIISANIDPKHLGEIVSEDTSNKDVYVYKLNCEGKEIPIFNMWHFSAPSKSDFTHYYKPIKEILKKDYNDLIYKP